MKGEGARFDGLFGEGVGDQLFGQLSALLGGDHPTDDIAAKDVEDHVQMEVGPLGRAFQLRNVPTPYLVGLYCQQFRFGVGGMPELIASLTGLALVGEPAIQVRTEPT